MRFGIVWPLGAGALHPKRQKSRLLDLGIDDHRIVVDIDDLPDPRPGSEWVSCTLLGVAEDIVTLSIRYRGLMREDGSLTIDGLGTFSSWDQFPELLRAYNKAKGRKQTERARANAGAPPKGPRGLGVDDIKKLRELWADPNVTKADIAQRFNVKWTTVNRWGKDNTLKLGEKAKPPTT